MQILHSGCMTERNYKISFVPLTFPLTFPSPLRGEGKGEGEGGYCLMRVDFPSARIVPSSLATRAFALINLLLTSVISP